MTTSTHTSSPKEHRDLRYRKQLFPQADQLVFNTSKKGFVPLPILLRKLLGHLSPPQLRVLIYLMLRASKYCICYPTLEEIAHDLKMAGRKNLTPHLKKLEQDKFISTRNSGGKTFFLIHDPRVPAEYLLKNNRLSNDEVFEIDELLDILHQPPLRK